MATETTSLYFNLNDLQQRLQALSCCIGKLGAKMSRHTLGGKECVEEYKLLRQLLTYKRLFKNYTPVGTTLTSVPAVSAIATFTPVWTVTASTFNVILTITTSTQETYTLTSQTDINSYFNNLCERINTTSTYGYLAQWDGTTITIYAGASRGNITGTLTFSGSGVNMTNTSSSFSGGVTAVSTTSTEDDNVFTEQEAQDTWDWISRQCTDCFDMINETYSNQGDVIVDPSNRDIKLYDSINDTNIKAL
jgi:hypothetical protein